MFKLIFRMMFLAIFLVFISAALAIWKGGEPFRYFGEGVIVVGQSIEKFGDFVDEFVSGSDKLRRKYDKLKDIIKDDDKKAENRKAK